MADIPTPVRGQTYSNGAVTSFTESSSVSDSQASQAVLAEYEQGGDNNGEAPAPANEVSVVKGATNAQGQTTWNVVVNQTQDASGTGEPTTPAATTAEAAQSPHFSSAQSAIAAGNANAATQAFGNLFSDSWMNNPNIDINGLIQAVMRNAYEDNQADLKYYALKVQFYNNLKKNIRNELARARNYQATHEQSGTNSSNTMMTGPGYVPGPSWDENFDGTNTTPVSTTSELATGAQQDGSTPTAPSGTTSCSTPSSTPTTTSCSTPSASPGTSASPASTTSSTVSSPGTSPSGAGGGVSIVNPPPAFTPPLFGAGSGNSSSASDWQVYKTSSGAFVAVDLNGSKLPGGLANAGEVRVYGAGTNGQPGAMQEQIWGDPHLDESGTGLYTTPNGSVAGFDLSGNSSLVLPDGSQIDLTTTSLNDGHVGITGVDVVSGNDHFQVTSNNGQTTSSANQNNGSTWASQNATSGAGGGIFALDPNGGAPAMYNTSTSQWDTVISSNSGQNVGYNTGGNTSVTNSQAAASAPQKNVLHTSNQMDAYVQNLEDTLQSVGDDAQLAQTDLQNMSQTQQQTLETLSNLSKSFHDLSMAIIRNISG